MATFIIEMIITVIVFLEYFNTNKMTELNNKTNEKKTIILEWEGTELKGDSLTCERFKTISGEKEAHLLFSSSFFAKNDNKFKKGDIYRFSTSGIFVKDGGVIQKIDGEYEFQKITSSLFIKELWEEKNKLIEKLSLSEEDLKKKKEDVGKVNQKWLDSERSISNLQEKLNNLQSEKESSIEEINFLKEDLKRKLKDVENSNQNLIVAKEEFSSLQVKFSEIQFEKIKIENERMTPERQKYLLQEKEDLQKELDSEKNKKQTLTNRLEEIQDRTWKENIQARLKEEKERLNQAKISFSNKLEINQKAFLETLLIIQEQFDNLIFEDVDPRICSPMKNQLQQTKDKLISENKEISLEEIEDICKMKSEIIKLEFQQKQWDKLEKIQEQTLYAFVEVR
ncbi:MAG: hypothetical protein LBR43_00870 [Spiroplasmataceae bacterium]|nr:hypothetical protein [Spiroplasmataceae bacterium]